MPKGGDLLRNPHVVAEILYRNTRAFADEGVAYIEPQMPVFGFLDRAGVPLAPGAVLAIYRQRMKQADAQATGVVVREYGLSWAELRALGRNSLAFSFLDDATKSRLLTEYERRMDQFAADFQRQGMAALNPVQPLRLGFICRHYGLCNEENDLEGVRHGNG